MMKKVVASGQKKPAKHWLGTLLPAIQKEPGGHTAHAVTEVAPVVLPYVPPGQGVPPADPVPSSQNDPMGQTPLVFPSSTPVAPAPHHCPATQGWHVSTLPAAEVLDHVPAGHSRTARGTICGSKYVPGTVSAPSGADVLDATGHQ